MELRTEVGMKYGIANDNKNDDGDMGEGTRVTTRGEFKVTKLKPTST